MSGRLLRVDYADVDEDIKEVKEPRDYRGAPDSRDSINRDRNPPRQPPMDLPPAMPQVNHSCQ